MIHPGDLKVAPSVLRYAARQLANDDERLEDPELCGAFTFAEIASGPATLPPEAFALTTQP